MLNISYCDDLKGEPAILMTGEEVDLILLSEFFDSWSREPTPVSLSDLPFVNGQVSIDVESFKDGETLGMRVRSTQQLSGKWFLQPEMAHRFSGLVQGVAESELPSHTYLDAGTDDVCVMVSKGEYALGEREI